MKKIMALAAVLGLGFGAVAGATGLTTQVYFENESGPASVVNVYVDGQLMFGNVFATSVSGQAMSLTPGEHKVVVTPNYAQPGQADIVAETINVPASGSYTLALSDNLNDSHDLSGYSLDLNSGTPDSE